MNRSPSSQIILKSKFAASLSIVFKDLEHLKKDQRRIWKTNFRKTFWNNLNYHIRLGTECELSLYLSLIWMILFIFKISLVILICAFIISIKVILGWAFYSCSLMAYSTILNVDKIYLLELLQSFYEIDSHIYMTVSRMVFETYQDNCISDILFLTECLMENSTYLIAKCF